MKRVGFILICSTVFLLIAGVVAVAIWMRSDPEVPDDVLRQRLEAKLLGHDARDVERVFAEEHVEREPTPGIDGILRDAGRSDFMLKIIFIQVHLDNQGRVASIETTGRWEGS